MAEPRTIYKVFLPPSHPFMRLSDAEWENLWGPHVERIKQKPITATEVTTGDRDA